MSYIYNLTLTFRSVTAAFYNNPNDANVRCMFQLRSAAGTWTATVLGGSGGMASGHWVAGHSVGLSPAGTACGTADPVTPQNVLFALNDFLVMREPVPDGRRGTGFFVEQTGRFGRRNPLGDYQRDFNWITDRRVPG